MSLLKLKVNLKFDNAVLQGSNSNISNLHFTGTAPKSPENDFIRDVKDSTSFSDRR